ncbi:MAG: response regulator transcription factor [Candidatus Acidiferrales bacterium]|jgi:two-component system copper resistance phosphate regulon response regulator CusR
MRILVVEDDRPMASFLSEGLQAEQYAVDVAADGAEARHMAEIGDYDLVILDINLPKLTGFEVLKEVRQKNPNITILLLTDSNQALDRAKVLDMGADDYLTKPLSLTELSARIRALMRRSGQPFEAVLKVEDVVLDRVRHVVRRNGQGIDLTPKEFGLLEFLMRNAGHRVTRDMIVENVWKLGFDTHTNVVDVYISYLRKKIDAGHERKLIRTIRGVGYQVGRPKEESRTQPH